MSKARFVLFLFVVGPLFAAAQAAPQRPADDFPSLNTPGETTPQAVSDLNAQLIWLLAAAPISKQPLGMSPLPASKRSTQPCAISAHVTTLSPPNTTRSFHPSVATTSGASTATFASK
jgi:hypothetical protein